VNKVDIVLSDSISLGFTLELRLADFARTLADLAHHALQKEKARAKRI
jgi:hypothetical protein